MVRVTQSTSLVQMSFAVLSFHPPDTAVIFETKEEKKSHRGLYQGGRVNVLEHRTPALTKKRRHTSGLVT